MPFYSVVLTIRSALACLVLLAALPVWLASALLLYQVQTNERALIERDAAATVNALMVAIDRDLASAQTAASLLAWSTDLLNGDIRSFYKRTIEAMGSNFGERVVLVDAAGQELVNTVKPYGDPLPAYGNHDLIRQVFATAKPVISDLIYGTAGGPPIADVVVPVMRDGKVDYDASN